MLHTIRISVNSEIFDRTLLPSRPEVGFTWQSIIRLHNIWKIRIPSKDGKRKISEENFIEDCLDLFLCSENTCKAIYILSSKLCVEASGHSDWLILILFIQLIHDYKIRMIRSSSCERLSQDTWPLRKDRLTTEKKKSPKTHEEEVQLQFLSENFSNIWNLLEDGTKEASKIWNYLLKPTISDKKSSDKMTFCEIIRDMEAFEVPEFVKSRLVRCNNGVLNCIKSGRWVAWPLGHNIPQQQQTKPKMATDSHLKKERKLVVLNQLSQKTLGRYSSTLEGATVKIHRCNHSYMYLLSPMESLTVTKCLKTRVVCGLVNNVIRIKDCSHMEIVAVGDVILVGGTADTKLYVNSTQQVIIDGGSCRNITILPYCANFKGLEESLEKFPNAVKYHRDCLLINTAGHQKRDDIVMFSENPRPILVPFQINIESENDILRKEKDVLESWNTYQKSQDLSIEERRTVTEEVATLFQDWCRANRKHRELTGLKSLASQS